ncbi:hypothetical protein JTB14_027162 [Gonioctena quinquepunctata]|nr:hypothetical protein JTB14_027162 [Gonioctena quinquepunctata]
MIEFLKKNKNARTPQKKPRGKKIKVEPGKSVILDETESSDKGDYSEHNESSDNGMGEVSNEEEISEAEELQEGVLVAQQKIFGELVVNDFVIV